MNVNRLQKNILAAKILRYFGEDLTGKTIAVWGLAFKPNTDDIREAPALYIINDLIKAGAKVIAYDPEAMENVKAIYNGQVEMAEDQYTCVENADALAIITEWSVFRTPNFDRVGEALNNKIIFDGRNLYNLDRMKELGFHYESIGRSIVGAKVEAK